MQVARRRSTFALGVAAGRRVFQGAKRVVSERDKHNKAALEDMKRRKVGKRKAAPRKRGGGNSSLGISRYHESKRMYRAKRFGGKKRRAHTFKKRVMAVVDKRLSSQIALYRAHLDLTASSNSQGYFACSLFGEYGNTGSAVDIGSADLLTLINSEPSTINTAPEKIDIKSGYLDMYLTNTGTSPTGTVLYVDIYKYACRRDTYQYDGVAGFYSQTCGDGVTTTGGTALGPTVYGVTPFMNTNWCNHFKILSVDRIVLGAGESFNLQLADKRLRTYFFQKTNKTVCKKGWTKGFFCIYKGAAGFNVQDVASNLEVECLRTYNFVAPNVEPVVAGYQNIE